MDVIEELLWQKPAPDNLDQEKWNEIDDGLLDAFLNKLGIHTNETENFDKHLGEILNLLKEHVKLNYIDEQDNYHHLYLADCYFVRPYESKFGLDNPEQALLRNNYEGTVRGTVVYTIHRKKVVPDDVPSPMTDVPEGCEIPVAEDIEVEELDVDGAEGSEDDAEEGPESDDDFTDEDDSDSSDEEDEGDSKEHGSEKPKKPVKTKKPVFFFHHNIYEEYTEQVHRSVKDNHLIMDIPVMVNSSLCIRSTPFAPPFLYSRPYLEVPSYCVSRTFKVCPHEEYFINNRVLSHYNHKVEIRSKFYQSSKRFRTNCTLKITMEKPKFRKNENWQQPSRFMVEIPHEKPKVLLPITILAMAFGWSAANFVSAVQMYLGLDKCPEVSMYLRILGADTDGCKSQRDAIRRVSKCLTKCKSMTNEDDISSYVSYTLRGEFLPNLIDDTSDNYDHENLRKGYMLAQSVSELIRLSPLVNDKKSDHEKWRLHDRRAYAVKRVDSPGEKLTVLARKYIKHFAKKGSSKLKNTVDNGKRVDLNSILNRKTIKLTASVRNGIWDSKSDASESNQNKTQMMITGYCSDANHLQTQKVVKFAMKKNSDPETLLTHADQIGRIDPYMTPESDRCGIVRNKALGGLFSPLVDLRKIMVLVRRVIDRYKDIIGWSECDRVKFCEDTSVYCLFGGIIGWVKNPVEFYKILVSLRRKGVLYKYLSIEYDKRRNCLFLNCDEGRPMRPLIIMEKLGKLIDVVQNPHFKYNPNPVAELLNAGVVEYLDAGEEMCGVVFTADCLDTAVKSKFEQTHMEIHGCFSMTVSDSKAFAMFNQGPRRMYTGNMEKRSISLKLFEDRGTTASYSLWYGQEPLLSDPVDKAMNLRRKEPNGTNVKFAVFSSDVNMEDAGLFKKETIERGMGTSSEMPVITVTLGLNCCFRKPDHKCKGKASEEKYDHLEEDGTPKIGSELGGGFAVVGKVFQCKQGGIQVQRCMTRFLPWGSTYVVKSVDKYPKNSLDPKIIRVTLTKTNLIVVGNKVYFGHGQKFTAGRIVPAIDLPFSESGPDAGTSPDVLINSCSLMRVTQGLLIEGLLGKTRALAPTLIKQYETLFLSQKTFEGKMRMSRKILRLHGLDYKGKEKMRCGKTGRLLKCEIYTGIAYMRILKQMAKDKLRSRDRGPTNELTRQTSVGKKHFGGQKIGEMENWNLHSHGMPFMFQNANYESADKFMIFFCTRCNMPCIGCIESDFYFCKMCEKQDAIVRLNIPYVTSLAFQELYAAGWGHTFVARKKPFLELGGIDEERIFHEYKNSLVEKP
jgi:DNA-directed RNA polymerase beta subunit